MVKITQETAGYFTFELDGVVIAKNIRNDLFIRNDSGIFRCDFKTATGANILSKQRILLSDVTVVNDLGVAYPPFATPNGLFLALIEVGYFDWMGNFNSGGGSTGVNRFKDLLDAFGYVGNDGKVPTVNEAQNRLDPTVLFNISNFSELYDVSSIAIDATLQNKTLTVIPITNGSETIYKIAWVDFPTQNNIPQDGFITLGTQSLEDGEFTASVGYTWRISGGLFGNAEEYSETIEPEEPGSYRKDKIVVTQDGENPFQYIIGIPSGEENSALEPQTPPGTLQLTTIEIFGDTISNGGDNPVIGTDHITKLSQSDVLINTSSSAITLNLDQNGKNRYRIQSTGTNAHILGISKIDDGIVIPNQDYPYNGKEILICNEKATDLIVDAGTPTSSLYAFEKALTIPPDGIATFKMYESEDVFKLKSTNFSIGDVPFINVKSFGAKGDGITDDTESIQDAIGSMEEGGTLYFPSGQYQTTGNIEITKKIKILGDGGNYSFDYTANEWTNGGSIIYSDSATNDLFYSSVAGITVNDVAFVNNSTTTPTAGTGLNLLNAGFIAMNNTSIVRFYDNMHMLNSASSSIVGCHFFNPIHYNLFMANPIIPDAGDNAIVNCHFSSNTYDLVTNIRWESGGGLKLTNNKFNPGGGGRSKYHIDVEVKGNTSILLLSNNSLEGFSQRAINIASDGTHIFDKIIINGNQMESFDTETTCIEIQGNGQKIRSVNIVNNTMIRATNSNSDPAVIVNDILQLGMSNNQFRGYINNKSIQNTVNVTDFDGNGGTVKGQLGIGNDFVYHGYRGFSNLGLALGTDLSGIIIKTDLDVSASENVNLIITGNTASDDLPIESHLQLANVGNGSIVGSVILNKGFPFSDAKAFYLDDKLCLWVKPETQYSNYNFEIQTTGLSVQIVDRVIGPLPSGRTGEVDFINHRTISTIDGTVEVENATASNQAAALGQIVAKGVSNTTTVVLTSSALNSTYPTATTGFRVYALSILSGAMVYEKTDIASQWIGTQTTMTP